MSTTSIDRISQVFAVLCHFKPQHADIIGRYEKNMVISGFEHSGRSVDAKSTVYAKLS